MSCAAIMTPNPLTLSEDDSVAAAVERLIDSHNTTLPVVDAEGRYAGMFGLYDLLSLVVPRVALAGNLLANLRFIGSDPEDLRRKFRDVNIVAWATPQTATCRRSTRTRRKSKPSACSAGTIRHWPSSNAAPARS